MLKYIYVLCTLILLTGCANIEKKLKVSLGQEFTLQVGQIAQVDKEGFEIKFEKVLEDSRCPKGVTCIWAGQVRCELSIKDNESTTSLELTEPGLTDSLSLTTNNKFKIYYHVQPYPEAGQEIAPDKYRIILKVEQN